MSEEGKKFSFSFSKSIKKTALQNVPAPEEKKIDYVDCVDEKAIKIIGSEEKEDEPLVIPCVGKNDLYYKHLQKTVEATLLKSKSETAQKEENVESNSNISTDSDVKHMEVDSTEGEPVLPASLEQQAAQEILNDLKSNKEQSKFIGKIPTILNDDDDNKKESTLEDHERVPIEGYGMAMLRGMGWTPETDRVVDIKIPERRPIGMGLGADKLAIFKGKTNLSAKEERLKCTKGSLIKIIGGKYSGSYGKVIGFDGVTDEIDVKLELGGNIVHVKEFWVQPVTSEEYNKDSRLLNAKKIQEDKNGGMDGEKKQSTRKSDYTESKKSKLIKEKSRKKKYSSSDSSEHERSRKKNSAGSSDKKNRRNRSSSNESSSRRRNNSDSSIEKRDEKKSKKKRYESSEEDSSVERKSRRERYRSRSDSSREKEKRKKSKKRDSSEEKNKEKKSKKSKKHKSKDRSNYKKYDYSDSSKRSKTKKSKKSRSRSNSSSRSRRRSRSCSYSPKRYRSHRSSS